MALYTVAPGAIARAADINQIINLLNGTTADTPLTVSNRVKAVLPGAGAAAAFAGGTTSGAPTGGTFVVGDFVIDQSGGLWVCTAAGTPGTWVNMHTPTLGSGSDIKKLSNAAVAGSSGKYADAQHQHPNTGLLAGVFNVMNYGALGDGSHDDSAAINAAIVDAAVTGGTVILPPPTNYYYVTSSINMKSNVTLAGTTNGAGGTVSQGVVIDAGSNAIDVIVIPTGSISTGGIHFRDIQIKHGSNGLKSIDFVSVISLERVQISGQVHDGIHIEGGIEECTLRDVKINGQGDYGWHHVNTHLVGSGNTKAYIDKSSFYDVLITGTGKDGWHIEALTSDTVTWYNPIITFCGNHAFFADCGAAGWTFINANTETNGTAGKQAVTTGTITGGSTTLTVASGVGIANSDPITVAGAGSFKDLQTTVVSGGGTTTLTLAAAASVSVTNAEVTNRAYDDFSFNASIGSASDLTWIGGVFGSGVHCRYAVKGDTINTSSFIGVSLGRPAYCVDLMNAVGVNGAIRQVNAIGQSTLRNNILAGGHTASEIPWTMIGSPPGKPFYLVQRDTLDNGTGTFGSLIVHRRDGSEPFVIDSSGNVVQNMGAAGLYAHGLLNVTGAATMAAISATSLSLSTTLGVTGLATLSGGLSLSGGMVSAFYPATPALVAQSNASIYAGSGAPSNSNGSNGDYYVRSDGSNVLNGGLPTLYQKQSGSWVALKFPIQTNATLTPSSVAAFQILHQTFTVTGLVTGEPVSVSGPSQVTNMSMTEARVSSTDTLELTFTNMGGAPITPSSGTYKVTVWR